MSSGTMQEQPVRGYSGVNSRHTTCSPRVSRSESINQRSVDFDTPAMDNAEGVEEQDGDISELHDNIMKQSRTIDDFTRIIADWRSEREHRQRGDGASMKTSIIGEGSNVEPNTLAAGGSRGLRIKESNSSLRIESNSNRLSLDVDAASQYSYEGSSNGDLDEIESTSPGANLSPIAIQAEGSSKSVKVRCTCCCGRGTRRCKRARRATREWTEVESDLRLAAEIGQALLRKNDSLQNEVNQNQQEYMTRIDSLMKKLTSSIREASQLDKNREQTELNLEAAEASNRSLIRELDETRRELTKLRGIDVRNTGLEGNLQRSFREVKDLKQELTEERKRSKKAEKMYADVCEDLRLARIEGKRQTFSIEDRNRRREEMKAMIDAKVASSSAANDDDSNKWTENLLAEVDNLQQESAQLRDMLEARGEELEQMREECSQQNDAASLLPKVEDSHRQRRSSDLPSKTYGALSSEIVEQGMSMAYSPSHSTQNGSERRYSYLLSPIMTSDAMFSPTASVASGITAETTIDDREDQSKLDQTSLHLLSARSATTPSVAPKQSRETRTAQLMVLIEMVQRIFSRLSNADVETLSKRLQKQNLTGDVGHLAMTTVNGIVRDVDALREHFRKAIEVEIRGRDVDTASLGSKSSGKADKESESLIAKKEFFALIKLFRELFIEMARLRKAVNEVSLQPQNAARILQEHLGINAGEDKGMGAWIGRLFAATPLPGVSSLTATSNVSVTSSAAQPSTASSLGRPVTAKVVSIPQLTSRASATVVPSTAAVEVKGSHANEQPTLDATNDRISQDRSIPSSQPQRSLARVRSRNLSGLFVGSVSSNSNTTGADSSINHFGQPHARLFSEQQSRHHRLSRIVDDDEVSNYQGFTPKKGLRPRNLSDSSIRTTYIEDEDKVVGSRQLSNGNVAAPTPISRIITPSTLSLQSSSTLHGGVVHSYTSSSVLSEEEEDSSAASTVISTSSTKEIPSSSFLSSLAAPRSTVSKALSFLSASPLATSSQLNLPPPTLRSTSSSARLSLAAAEGNAQHKQLPQRNTPEDLFRVGQSRARDMGF